MVEQGPHLTPSPARRPWRRRALLGALALALATAGSEGRARAEAFGEAGAFSLSIDQSFLRSSVDAFLVQGTIEAAVFPAHHFSLGMTFGGAYTGNAGDAKPGTNLAGFRAGPRIGYDFVLGRRASLWAQTGLDVRAFHASSGDGGSSTDGVALAYALDARFLIHPSRGFFIGAGPLFSIDLINSVRSHDVPKSWVIGMAGMVGGAF